MNDFRGLVPRHDKTPQSRAQACPAAARCPFSCAADTGERCACNTRGHWAEVDKGEVLALQGDSQDGLFVVLQGMLTLSKSLEDGRTQIVGLRFAGDFISARPSDPYWQVTVEAVQPSLLCHFGQRSLRDLSADSHFNQVLNERALVEVIQAQEHMMTLGRRAPMERLALFLLELGSRQENPDQDIRVPISRADIGDYLGLKGETISRLFTRLKDSGVITVHTPSRIALEDRDALEDLAEGRGIDLVPAAQRQAFFFGRAQAAAPRLAAAVP